MSLACTTIVSLLCFQGAVKTHLAPGAIAPHQVVTAKAYTVTVWSSDNIYTPDWRTMSEACIGARCYRYLKHCASASRKITCDYSFGIPGDDSALEIQLEARSYEELKRAVANILLISPEQSELSKFSLGAFAIESESHIPKACPRREPNKCMP
jgi:hypothetical protein